MYCRQCGVEYREGFTECSDCHLPLEAGSPPDPNAQADPSLDLVVVLETDNAVQAAMAKGILEDAGVPFYVLGQITRLINEVDPFLRKWVRIQVPRDREAEAREILEQMSQPVTDEEALGEKTAE
jgi:hypothetical protein